MNDVVDGGIVDGLYGYEAGQSGVGRQPVRPGVWDAVGEVGIGEVLVDRLPGGIGRVPVALGQQGVDEPGQDVLALEWINGNRSTLVDHHLSGLALGLTLATRPEQVYRALLEATAFGTQRIIDAFVEAGVEVTDLVLAGGLVKNAPLMQLYADVTGRAVAVAGSDQAPALGSAIHAAVAAKLHPDVRAAAVVMGRVRRDAYRPDAGRHAAYRRLYADYGRLYDYFGHDERSGGNEVMHRLRAARDGRPEGDGS